MRPSLVPAHPYKLTVPATILTVRRLVFGAAALIAVGVAAWALWPSPSWPAAFCKPFTRVTGSRTLAIIPFQSDPLSSRVITPGERSLLATLTETAGRAEAHAPTAQLHSELAHYVTMLTDARAITEVGAAINYLSLRTRFQLGDCGVKPIRGS